MKRILSIFIALCLCFSIFPLCAEASEIVANGTCGQRVSWELNSAGVLTISGTGAIVGYNYVSGEYKTTAPWSPYSSEINKIVIEDGVSGIGNWAFGYLSDSKSVSIPDSVLYIGNSAFYGQSSLSKIVLPPKIKTISSDMLNSCSALESVVIPNGVTKIEDRAFFGCAFKLSNISIPESVTSIGNCAFWGCANLQSFTIPDGVISIGDRAFQACSQLSDIYISASVQTIGRNFSEGTPNLKQIEVNPKNVSFSSENGVLFNYEKTTLIAYPEGKKSEIYYVPSSVSNINDYAFRYSDINTIVLPKSLKNIGASAFDECNSLKEVYYAGSKAQWNTVNIEKDNDPLLNATTHFNSFEPETPSPPPSTTPTPVVPDNSADSDRDGLLDIWEIKGLDYDSDGVIDVDLPKMGSDPNIPDVFVEIDWMEGCEPLSAALKKVFEQFKKHGINLHIDAGYNSVDFVTGKRWESLSGSNMLEYKDLTVLAAAGSWSPWVQAVKKNLAPSRRLVFKHCMFVNKIGVNGRGLLFGNPSGIANDIPGQYFVVADVRSWTEDPVTAVAGTFMHELGHTLGLHHGGDEDANEKPNYLSVMNYLFQLNGLFGTREVNYSDYQLPSINENEIDENDGIDPDGVIRETQMGAKWKFKGVKYSAEQIAGNAIDFNQNGKIEQSIQCNIDGTLGYNIIRPSINDWRHLIFNGGSIGANPRNGVEYTDKELDDISIEVEATTVEEELTLEAAIENDLIDHPAEQSNSFTDVKQGAYYYNAVLWAVRNGVTYGTSASIFSPNDHCTRAQMVTFLWRAAGCPKHSSNNPFKDVKSGAYYYDAVLWAVEKGITKGTSKTTFGPDNTVTRAQTVTFLWRMEGEPKVSTDNPFKDIKSGQYYSDAVLWAVKNGITYGTSKTTFAPNEFCTRGQIVTFLYRDLVKNT